MFILTGLLVVLLIVASFTGWGRLVSLGAFGSARGAWPIQASWGLCVFTVIGGPLNFFGHVSATANGVVLLAGIALFLFLPRAPSVSAEPPRSRADNIALACLALASLITIILSLFPLIWEPQDDAVAYASFPKKMLETGSLLEPFSFRRIVGFGGYQYLQTLAYPFLSHGALQVMDRGILSVLVAAALATYTRKRLGLAWPLASLAGIAFLAHPLLRINLAPASIFSLLSLSFLESFELTSESRELPALKRAAVLALLATGLLSLRANSLAIVGSLFLILVLPEQPQGISRISISKRFNLMALAAVISGLLLVPWSLLLHRSSGTFFFPFIKGNYNAAISMTVPLTAMSYLRLLWRSSVFSGLHILLLLTLTGAAVRAIPRTVIGYALAAIATSAAMISAFNLADVQALHRYYSPFTSIAFILTSSAWLASIIRWRSRSPAYFRFDAFYKTAKQLFAKRAVCWGAAFATAMAIAAGAGVVVSKAAGRVDWKRQRDWSKLSLQRSLEGRASRSYVAMLANAEMYRAALATIPKGAKVLSAIDAPFLLDYRDHNICLIDDVGVVAPPPGFPINGGPEDLVGYLKSQSVEYLLYVRPDRPWRESMAGAYNRSWWDSMRGQDDPNVRLRGPNYWWFFSAVEEVAERYRHLYDSNEAVVISLNERRSIVAATTMDLLNRHFHFQNPP